MRNRSVSTPTASENMLPRPPYSEMPPTRAAVTAESSSGSKANGAAEADFSAASDPASDAQPAESAKASTIARACETPAPFDSCRPPPMA